MFSKFWLKDSIQNCAAPLVRPFCYTPIAPISYSSLRRGRARLVAVRWSCWHSAGLKVVLSNSWAEDYNACTNDGATLDVFGYDSYDIPLPTSGPLSVASSAIAPTTTAEVINGGPIPCQNRSGQSRPTDLGTYEGKEAQPRVHFSATKKIQMTMEKSRK